MKIIDCNKEFLAVSHSVLNGNTYDIDKIFEKIQNLQKHSNKKIIPCFEGDILQVGNSDEVILTHQNFVQLSKEKYSDLKKRKLASSLKEVLDNYSLHKQNNKEQKIILCFEPKYITSEKTIENTIKLLKEYQITDVYFDSFFGDKLDYVKKYSEKLNLDYDKSLHLISHVLNNNISMNKPKLGFDVLTIPYQLDFSKNSKKPIIYGAVGSIDIFKKIIDEENVYGAYLRFEEGSGFKGTLTQLWNSVSNTEKLRKK
jgi:hypothetical protein